LRRRFGRRPARRLQGNLDAKLRVEMRTEIKLLHQRAGYPFAAGQSESGRNV